MFQFVLVYKVKETKKIKSVLNKMNLPLNQEHLDPLNLTISHAMMLGDNQT